MNKRLKKSLVILAFLSAFIIKGTVSAYEFNDLNRNIILDSDINASQQLGSFSQFASLTGGIDGGENMFYGLSGFDNKGIDIYVNTKGYDVNYTVQNIGAIYSELMPSTVTVKTVDEMTGEMYESYYTLQGGMSAFKNTHETTSSVAGGAIYVSEKDVNGVLTFNDSIIFGNQLDLEDKDSYGGAVYAGFVELKTNNTFFKENLIKSAYNKIFKGGAVHQDIGVGSANFQHTINNTYFIENKIEAPASVEAMGGALNIEKGAVEINSSYFGQNQIQAINGQGGAVALQSGNVKQADIKNSVFENNKLALSNTDNASTGSGGALYYYGSSSSGKINVDNSVFSQNSITATGTVAGTTSGGAIAASSGKTTVISNTKFLNNSVSNQIGNKSFGGALYTSVGSATVQNSTFDSNSAVLNQTPDEAGKSAQAFGGAIYLMNTSSAGKNTLTVKDSTFTNNQTVSTAHSKGGAIFANGVLKVENSTFKNNRSNSTSDNNYDAFGGAIYTDTYAPYAIVDNSTFENNSTTSNVERKSVNSGGGAYYNSKVSLIKDSSFKNNTAFGTQNKYNNGIKGAFGGAILNKLNGVLSIMADKKDVVFEGNRYGTADSGFKNNAIYTDDKTTVNLNAADGKKIVFNDNIESANNTAVLNINQTGTWDETTAPTTADNKISQNAGTTGEIVVNSDMSGFLGSVNLFGGKISLGSAGTLFNKAKAFVVKQNSEISFADGVIKEYDLGNLTLEDNLNVIIDADLNNANAQSDKLSASTIVNDNDYKILISKINIINDEEVKKVTTIVADDVLKDSVELSSNPDVVIEGAKESYLLTYDKSNGELTFKSATAVNNLNSAVAETQSDRLYSLAQDENVSQSLGKLGGADSTLTINGDNNSIIADNSQGSEIAGVEVDNSQKLSVNNVNEVKGFISDKGGFATNEGVMNIVDSSFKENTSKTRGGAIQNKGTLNIVADKKDVVFENNKAQNNEQNAIHSENGTINVVAQNSDIIFNDSITSNDSSVLNINKPDVIVTKARDVDVKGDVVVNSDMSKFEGIVNLFGGKLTLLKDSTFFVNAKSFNVKQNSNATVSFADKVIKKYDLGNLNLEDDLRIIIDADLAGKKADNFDAQTVNDNGNKIIISEINITSDLADDSMSTLIASDKLKDIFELSTNPDVNLVGTSNNYYLTYDKQNGELTFSTGVIPDLNEAFSNVDNNRIYAMAKDEVVVNPLGQMGGADSTMTISGNNNAIVSTNDSEGMTIAQGQTLNINNVKNIDGFKDNTAINNLGTINIENSLINDKMLNQGMITLNNATINEEITGNSTSNIQVKDNSTINNKIQGNTIELQSGTLTLGQNGNIQNAAGLVANGGSLSLANNAIQNTNLGNVTLNQDLNVKLDADLNAKEIDKIAVDSITANSNNINITDIVVLNPTTDETFSMSPIADGMSDDVKQTLQESIKYTGGEIVYSPIFKYNAEYDPDEGMLNFNRVKGGINPNRPTYNALNPGVLAAPVAAQLGGYLSQLNSYDEAFMNMDMYMLLPSRQRTAMKLRNRYALALAVENSNVVSNEISNGIQDENIQVIKGDIPVEDIITDTPASYTNDPVISQYQNRAGWFRPYATFEDVSLKGGPKVSNKLYGSYFGTDSRIKPLKRGWDGMWGTYIGYNGSHQSYDDVSIYQNGGTLGFSGMLFKNNFFTGLTANAGANTASADSFFGKDNFTMFLAGVASKTGYNFEFKEGKYIIQPSFMMSYSFVNSFDYTNASGVKISSDALHAITFEPGIKFIANFKNNYQPYMGVSFIANCMDKTNFSANDVALPDLSVKPFVKYGLGLRKLWGEKATGFIQAYVTNGGRNGVGLQAGVNMLMGKRAKRQKSTKASIGNIAY